MNLARLGTKMLLVLPLLLAMMAAPAGLQAQPAPPDPPVDPPVEPPAPPADPPPPEPEDLPPAPPVDPPPAPPVDPPPDPEAAAGIPAKATWSVDMIDASMLAGGSVMVTVTFDRDVPEGVLLWLTPSVRDWVTVTPESIAAVVGGTEYEVTIALDGVTLAELTRNLGGTLHVKQEVPPLGDMTSLPEPANAASQVPMALQRTLARPLAIDIVVDSETEEPDTIPAAVVNGADFSPGGIAGGQIFSVFGNGLGPVDPSSFELGPEGRVPGMLSDTQVLFDGLPAPMLFVQQGQLNGIVPFGVAGDSEVEMLITFRGNVSPPITLPVQAAAPALFTLDGSGSGPGAILNQDFSVNSPSNPAARGSVVMLFGTGSGPWAEGNIDGAVVGAEPLEPAQPVAVSVAEVETNVVFAGGSPGLVNGVIQVNAEIDVTTPPGKALPIQMTVGGVSSTAEVTIAVE